MPLSGWNPAPCAALDDMTAKIIALAAAGFMAALSSLASAQTPAPSLDVEQTARLAGYALSAEMICEKGLVTIDQVAEAHRRLTVAMGGDAAAAKARQMEYALQWMKDYEGRGAALCDLSRKKN